METPPPPEKKPRKPPTCSVCKKTGTGHNSRTCPEKIRPELIRPGDCTICQKVVETKDEERLECCGLLFHEDCIQEKSKRDERCPSCGHSHGPRRPVSIDASRPWDYKDHILARHIGCCHCCECYCGGNAVDEGDNWCPRTEWIHGVDSDDEDYVCTNTFMEDWCSGFILEPTVSP